jgi:hypothetical protein
MSSAPEGPCPSLSLLVKSSGGFEHQGVSVAASGVGLLDDGVDHGVWQPWKALVEKPSDDSRRAPVLHDSGHNDEVSACGGDVRRCAMAEFASGYLGRWPHAASLRWRRRA